MLAADALRPKHNRRTGRALFVQIQASGYAGGYTRVTDFIRTWRASAGKETKAFVPLKFDLGEAFHFDWSEEGLVVGGIYRCATAAPYTCSASETATTSIPFASSGSR